MKDYTNFPFIKFRHGGFTVTLKLSAHCTVYLQGTNIEYKPLAVVRYDHEQMDMYEECGIGPRERMFERAKGDYHGKSQYSVRNTRKVSGWGWWEVHEFAESKQDYMKRTFKEIATYLDKKEAQMKTLRKEFDTYMLGNENG